MAGVILATAVTAFLLGILAGSFVPAKITTPAGRDQETAGVEEPVCLGHKVCWEKVVVRLVADLQNSLAIIRGAVQLLEEETGYRSDVLSYTQIITGQVRRQNERLQALPAACSPEQEVC